MKGKRKTKIIRLPSAEEHNDGDTSGQLSLERCTEILCREGAQYSEEEVKMVRKLLYGLAELDYKYHCNLNSQNRSSSTTTIIPLYPYSDEESAQQKSHSILPRKYRRTG
jgi:hypothetical protein